ncbi:MAG: RNA methyltransferase [Prevotella sp.]|nr:RNA methyltransferase [Prevotella sp.]
MAIPISSVQNPRVKQLVLLQQKSSERRKTGLFVVEGQRETEHCLEAGYQLDSLYYCPELFVNQQNQANRLLDSVLKDKTVPLFNVTTAVYEKMAYRGTTEGLLAVVHAKPHTLDGLQLPDNPVVVVLESVEKPGNLGAVLRTADAAHADAVIVCDPLTDLYNPNLIRSSIGAIFTVPCVACSSEQCIAFLKSHGIQILTAQLQDSHLYYDTDMRRSTAIIMGTESTGLTDTWRQVADAHIRIPMLGRLDSLNVSVSAAILLFEAVRQRSAEHSD